jgi:hypothetical protein
VRNVARMCRRTYAGFWRESQKEIVSLEDLDIGEEMGRCAMEWTDLVHGRDRWRAAVNAVMILRVHEMLCSS